MKYRVTPKGKESFVVEAESFKEAAKKSMRRDSTAIVELLKDGFPTSGKQYAKDVLGRVREQASYDV